MVKPSDKMPQNKKPKKDKNKLEGNKLEHAKNVVAGLEKKLKNEKELKTGKLIRVFDNLDRVRTVEGLTLEVIPGSPTNLEMGGAYLISGKEASERWWRTPNVSDESRWVLQNSRRQLKRKEEYVEEI